jgi:hypothetical protein
MKTAGTGCRGCGRNRRRGDRDSRLGQHAGAERGADCLRAKASRHLATTVCSQAIKQMDNDMRANAARQAQ